MGDSVFIRCRTCCTAETGDPERVDHDVFRRFVGGLESNDRSRFSEAVSAIALAIPIKAVAESMLVLTDASLTSGHEIDVLVSFGPWNSATTIDLAWFAAHGSHDLVPHCYEDIGACRTCWGRGRIRMDKHTGDCEPEKK